MSDNYNRDDIPVQDITEAHRAKSLVTMDKDVRMTLTSSNIRRGDEFQDRLHQLTDENLFLKKHARKFEEKSKQLEAKLSRILSEKKYVGRKDEYEVEESRHRIIELEYQVGMLKDRLQVAKQQLVSYTKIFPPHSHSKINKSKQSGKLSTSTSSVGIHNHGSLISRPHNFSNSELSEQFELLLVEAKVENQGLENQLQNVRDQLRSLQRELGSTKELLQIKEIAHEDEINLLRTQLGDTDSSKKKLSDNIQLIRLQRDSRRATSWLSTLETQCKTLETNLATSQETCQQLETQLNSAQEELREVNQQNLNLKKQVEDNLAEINRVKELEAQIFSLKEENGILKEANDSLQSKAVSASEKVRKVESEEAALKAQISQMEITIKKEILSKTDLYSDVSREKHKCMTLTETLNDLKQKFSAMELELKKLERTSPASLSVVTFLEPGRNSPAMATTSESAVFDEMPERGDRRVSTISDTCVVPMNEGNNKQSSPCLHCQSLEKDLGETRSSMGKLQDDLLKTKNLLKGQMATNRECHKEIEILSQKLEKADKFHNEKLQEFMKVLEERATQMLSLEKKFELMKLQGRISPDKVKTVLVNTEVQVNRNESAPAIQVPVSVQAPFPFPRPPTQALQEKDVNANDQVEAEETPSVEIFLDKFVPLPAQRQLVGGKNMFATWEFNEQETKYSPIVRNGIFNTGSKHIIQDKENFKAQIEVQIHLAIGPSDCQTVGKGIIFPDKHSCIIYNVTDPSNELGELQYKFTLRGAKPNPFHTETKPKPAQSESPTLKPKISERQHQPENVEIPPVPKPKPRKGPLPISASASAAEVEIADSESSQSSSNHSNSTYSISPQHSPKSLPKHLKKSKLKPKTSNISDVSDSEFQSTTATTKKSSKLSRGLTINDENEYPLHQTLPTPLPVPTVIPIPVKTRSGSSPKKPILRRESSSPEVKSRKNHKRVTVTEIVEERRISASTSDENNTNDEKYEKQRRAAEIATAAAIAADKIRHRKQQHQSDSSGSSSGEVSGDGNDVEVDPDATSSNILVVRPKEASKGKPENENKLELVEAERTFQIPVIQVEGFELDSSANTTGETSIDLDVLSPAEIINVTSKGKGYESRSKTKKNKLTLDSTTEIDHSSGSGSGDESQSQGQEHSHGRVQLPKPKQKQVLQSQSSTEFDTESSTLTATATTTAEGHTSAARRYRKPKGKHKRNVMVSESQGQGEEDDSLFENLSEESSSQDSDTFKQTIRIEIAYVIFNSPSRIWSDPKIKKIFVEYRFLDFDPEEMETPTSLAKPQPGKKAEFNFIKIFLIDTRERRKLLQTMLVEKRRLRFTVVSEPPENDTLDCEDIGYAYVPIAGLQKEDLVQEQITIYDAENPRLEIGSICVSIQARDVLRTL